VLLKDMLLSVHHGFSMMQPSIVACEIVRHEPFMMNPCTFLGIPEGTHVQRSSVCIEGFVTKLRAAIATWMMIS
jgi:hypothetical protein